LRAGLKHRALGSNLVFPAGILSPLCTPKKEISRTSPKQKKPAALRCDGLMLTLDHIQPFQVEQMRYQAETLAAAASKGL
jgi:hypothetical protein